MKRLFLPCMVLLCILAGCQYDTENYSSSIPPSPTDGIKITSTETHLPTVTKTVTATIRPSMTTRPSRTPDPHATPTWTVRPSPTSEPNYAITPMATRIWNDSIFSLWAEKEKTVLSLEWSLDEKYLFAGIEKGGMASFDMRFGKLITYVGNNASIYALDESSDGKYLAAALGDDGSIRLLSMETGSMERTIWPAHESIPTAVAFGPNSDWLVSCGLDGKIKIWDVSTGELRNTIFTDDAGCTDMLITPDGIKLVAAYGFAEFVRVWDTNTWQELISFPVDLAEDIAISPDGNRLVTAASVFHHEANVWNLNTGELIFTLGNHPGWVWAVAYSPDGKIIATGGVGECVYLWDAETGEIIYELYTEPNFMKALEFNPEGTMLAAGGNERIWLWKMSELDNPGGVLGMK